jgi:hypothetical protein
LQWQFNKTFLYNIWEYIYEQHAVNSDPLITLVEEDLLGFKPFTGNNSNPSSFSEAQERPMYTALNRLGVDGGNPIFGPVSVVFSPDYVRNITFLTAIDNGMWEAECNFTFNHHNISGSWPGPLDCSQSMTPGTYGAIAHVVLASEMFWKNAKYRDGSNFPSPLIIMLQRQYQQHPPDVNTHTQIQYLEADLAGAVFIPNGSPNGSPSGSTGPSNGSPNGVKFVIGQAPSLFGTAAGLALQQWCVKNDWALLWSSGFNCIGTPTECNGTTAAARRGGGRGRIQTAMATLHSTDSNATLTSGVFRLIDPLVQSLSRRPLNVTSSAQTVSAFAQQWAVVAKAINSRYRK